MAQNDQGTQETIFEVFCLIKCSLWVPLAYKQRKRTFETLFIANVRINNMVEGFYHEFMPVGWATCCQFCVKERLKGANTFKKNSSLSISIRYS